MLPTVVAFTRTSQLPGGGGNSPTSPLTRVEVIGDGASADYLGRAYELVSVEGVKLEPREAASGKVVVVENGRP